jgi:Peptidase family M48
MLMVFIYPTWIQPLFNKLSPLPEGNLRSRIESLASGLKFPLKHLYEIDGSKRSSHSNAYFFGLPWVSADSFTHAIMIGSSFSPRVNTSLSLTL